MQSDSPTEAGTTPDTRSLTDLWRDYGAYLEDWSGTAERPEQRNEFVDTRAKFWDRLDAVAARHNQATIRGHARLEHPAVAWDAQAAVFTTGRFEGRAR